MTLIMGSLRMYVKCLHSEMTAQTEGGEADDMTTEVSLSSQRTGSGGLTPVAIVGVIIGLLVLLVLGAAIVVVVLYLVRRQQVKGKNSTGSTGNGLGNQLFAPIMYTF